MSSGGSRHVAASRHDTPDKAGARAGLWHGLARLWDRREPDAGDGGARALERVFARLSALGQQVALEGWRVLTASMDIARESKAHADRLRESLPMMEEIRQSAAQATTLCGDARTRVLEARRMMEQCVTLSEQRTAMIAELVSSIARSHDAFAQVSSNATEVERFLEVIQEIGAQTNLLALNAAIEAARAGAHGTGFLVVAREMRLLADKTESATHEIRQITDRMQTATHSAGMVLTAALRTSSAGEEQGRRVAAAVHGTQPPMHEAEANLLRVAEAAGQQMRSLEQLEEQWRAMREGASDSTQDADASAELSMQTIGLAVGFFTDLAELAEVLGELPLLPVARGGDGQAAAWRGRAAGLVRESARCAAESGVARLEEMRPQLAAGLRELKLECTSRGLASRRGRTHSGDTLPELCVGGRAINGSFDQVDVVLRRTGLSATLFVLAEEEDDGARVFYRVSTTVKRSDGNRAVKTSLNPRGSVAEKLLAGEPTYGYAYILGLPHLAAYEPIRDAVGEVIGAWYVGLAIKDEGKPAARAAA